jgi:HK97 family phage major capsid protein
LNRPVREVNWLTGGRIVVGDFSKAAIVQSEGLTMRQSDSHGNTFVSNEITFLLERTEGLAIFRPDAFVTAVLTA